jgi:hypothetical protein
MSGDTPCEVKIRHRFLAKARHVRIAVGMALHDATCCTSTVRHGRTSSARPSMGSDHRVLDRYFRRLAVIGTLRDGESAEADNPGAFWAPRPMRLCTSYRRTLRLALILSSSCCCDWRHRRDRPASRDPDDRVTPRPCVKVLKMEHTNDRERNAHLDSENGPQ